MSFRLLAAAMLTVCSCGLHAQSRIDKVIDGCFRQHGNNQPAVRGCIAKIWGGSLDDVEKDAGEKAARQAKQACQTSLKEQAGKLESECSAKLKQSMKVAIDAEVVKEQATRRAKAFEAMERFFAEFETSSKSIGRDIELFSRDRVAGTILLRRRGAAAAVVLILGSFERVHLQENDTQLRFECPPNDQCVSHFSRDGSFNVSTSVFFTIPATQSATLLELAEAARLAFKAR